jgi:hypothetical protein
MTGTTKAEGAGAPKAAKRRANIPIVSVAQMQLWPGKAITLDRIVQIAAACGRRVTAKTVAQYHTRSHTPVAPGRNPDVYQRRPFPRGFHLNAKTGPLIFHPDQEPEITAWFGPTPPGARTGRPTIDRPITKPADPDDDPQPPERRGTR